ncbi:serine protease 46 [Sigmodon hispidus]
MSAVAPSSTTIGSSQQHTAYKGQSGEHRGLGVFAFRPEGAVVVNLESKDPANYTVKVGVQSLPDNSSELLITNIVIHENFNNHMSDDIALIKLKYPVTWSPLVQPICLPTNNFKPTIDTMCWVIGWGQEKTKEASKTPYNVQGLAVRIVNNEICNHRYQFLLAKNQKKFIGRDMLCTSSEWGLDTCQDTSGSSLVCQMNKTWVQMGVVSWNVGCGRRQFPSIFTSTSHFTQWIKRQIKMVSTTRSYSSKRM